MKPKNKFQSYIIDISNNLKPLSEVQIEWSKKECLKHIAFKQKSGKTFCLDCGHQWIDKNETKICECPKCNTKLSIEITKKQSLQQKEYFHILEVIDSLQVIRIVEITSSHKINQQPRYYIKEIIRQFIRENGKHEFVARLRSNFFYRANWSGGFEIRNSNQINNYDAYPTKIYPIKKILPILKRNGFKSSFYKRTPFDLFTGILTNPKAETLLKSKQISLLQVFLSSKSYSVNKYWNTIKICIRNKYNINDASIYLDYLFLLNHFKIDLLNPKFVCPADFRKEHDALVMRRNKEIKKQEEERRKANLEKQIAKTKDQELDYQKDKSKYFDFMITTKSGIFIKVIDSVKQFLHEGEALNHCVFTNEYYKKKDSLILSAKLHSRRLETIEIDLSTFTIQQVRGKHNKPTKYNSEIREELTKNLYKLKRIRNRMTA